MHIHPQATSSKGVTRTRTVNLPGSPTKQGQQLKPSQDPQGILRNCSLWFSDSAHSFSYLRNTILTRLHKSRSSATN